MAKGEHLIMTRFKDFFKKRYQIELASWETMLLDIIFIFSTSVVVASLVLFFGAFLLANGSQMMAAASGIMLFGIIALVTFRIIRSIGKIK